MKTKGMSTLLLLLLMASLSVGLMACGGGGGGSAGISYSGITTQAKIDETNATALVLGTWTSSDIGSNIDIFDSAQATGDTLYGSCNVPDGDSGAIVNGEVNDATGAFNGTITFTEYCEEGVTIDGLANFTGLIDTGTEEIVNFTLSFSALTVDEAGESVTLKGTLTANYVSSPILVTMSFVIKDNTLMKTYQFTDAQIQLVGGMDFVEIVGMSGRYYDPDSGYVEISVGEAIRISDNVNWPSSGTIILTGAQGTSGGNTKARLTFLSLTEYQVDADTDGDGLYNDYNPPAQLW